MTQNLLISEARSLFPKKNGRLIHIHTIRRWIAKGVKVNGVRVRLKSERVGARITTRPEWVREFIRACNGKRMEPDTIHQRSISDREAERFLIAEGVYGRKAQRQMLGRKVSARRGNLRTVPAVLPHGTAQDSERTSDTRGIDRSQADETRALAALN